MRTGEAPNNFLSEEEKRHRSDTLQGGPQKIVCVLDFRVITWHAQSKKSLNKGKLINVVPYSILKQNHGPHFG